MSDPVTNAEVEDVLSSIRRLVSEDKRPMQSKAPEPAPDRLVLTPALRVAEEEQAPQPAAESVASTVEAVEPAAEPEAAPRPQTNISDLVTSDTPLDVYGDGPAPLEDFAEAPAPEAAADITVDDLADDYSNDPYGFDDESDFDGEGDELTLKAMTHSEGEERKPWSDSPVAEAPAVPEKLAPFTLDQLSQRADDSAPAASEVQSDDVPTAPGPVLEESVQPEDTSATKAGALSAKIAALETAIGKISDTWEPDDPGESDYAGTDADDTMAWEDDTREAEPTAPLQFTRMNVSAPEPEIEEAVEVVETPQETVTHADAVEVVETPEETEALEDAPEVVAVEPEAAAEPVLQQPSPQIEEPVSQEPATQLNENVSAPEPEAAIPMPADDQMLDEDALRDLISDIVRAELQGALGERITRNVRKLVRREIHRALTAQDLE